MPLNVLRLAAFRHVCADEAPPHHTMGGFHIEGEVWWCSCGRRAWVHVCWPECSWVPLSSFAGEA